MDDQDTSFAAEFLRYNRWANLRLLDACLALSADQLAATAPGTYGSIHATWVHIVGSEAYYHRLLTGQHIGPPQEWWDSRPALAEIRPVAAEVGQALAEVAARLKPTDTFYHENDQRDYHAMVFLIQVVDHGIEHRTNITTILAQLGLAVPDLDGWSYLW
jgi:uncharacterized damage-inducible protein DinB